MKGIIDYWWNANTMLNVIYSRGSYSVNEQKHYHAWNSQDDAKGKAYAQGGFTRYLKAFFSQNSRWKFRAAIFNTLVFQILYLVGMQERSSITNRLLSDQPGVGPSTEPGTGLGVHSLGLHQRALGWHWEPKSWDVSCGEDWASLERERRAAGLLTIWFSGEICRFCESHKTVKRSSERSRNLRQQSQPFSVVLKLYMEIFADDFYLSQNRSW